MGTALVVGLLIVMCGEIAYIGDLLGRRMGKKRLSILNLRPRHTAVVFTVVTGMVIASVTLGALMLLSRGVRIAVTRGEQLLYENHRLKQQRHRLDLVRRQLVAQREALEMTNRGLESNNRALDQGNASLKAAQETLEAETQRLQLHNQALQGENGKLEKRNGRLEARNSALTHGNLALVARNRTLASDNGQLGRRNQRLAAGNKSLVASNGSLSASNAELEKSNTGLVRQRDGLREATRKAQFQLTSLHAELIRTSAQLSQARQELTNAARVAIDTQRRAESGEDLAVGNVIVHRGEELSRRVIPASAPEELVRSTLRELLQAANAEVSHRVSLVRGRVRPVCLDPADTRVQQIPDDVVAALMTESHAVDGPVSAGPMSETHSLVVRALATRNASDENADPVVVVLNSRVNQMAFRKGDEVASLVVSTAATTGQLLKNLLAFLQRQVREEAVKHSIMPDVTGSVGETDYEELLDVVARVKRLPGQARIGAVAAAEAWSAGPLQLDFYVVPADTRVAKKKGEE